MREYKVTIKSDENGIYAYVKLGLKLGVAEVTIVESEYNELYDDDCLCAKLGYFSRINVPQEYRRVGIGNSLLKAIINEAKELGISLVCEINPYGEMTYEQLKEWYMKNGFMQCEISGTDALYYVV